MKDKEMLYIKQNGECYIDKDCKWGNKTEDKKKQIEEITKDLKENLRLCAGVKLLDHQVETIAYELSKKYQPKLPKDSVVISREEYQKDFSNQFNKGYKYGSKETAEKAFEITKKIIDKKYAIETPWTRATLSNIIDQIEKEFAKQFNVEIKE